jgi:hypothetical protein
LEKQGVTFSEQSWRDFLDFLRDVKPPAKETDDTDTNSFVDAYYKQQKSKSKPKADEISNAIYGIMQGRIEPGDRIQSVDIRNELHRVYGIQVAPKAFSSKMIKAMYAYPVIIKTGRGEFTLSDDALLQEVSNND